MEAAPETTQTSRSRGRRPAASRRDVLDAAVYRYLRGRRVDVQAIAAELGLGRSTIYRWFGSRDGLIGEAIVAATEPVFAEVCASAHGTGAAVLLDIFDRFNRRLADAPALRQFLEHERDTALRIITSSGGSVQPRMVAMIGRVIEEQIDAGHYDPPVEPADLAYAIVRLAEAYLFNDALAGMRGDVDRLRNVEAALLGVPRRRSAH
ncbi:MAG TPA: QsdR family transcriptional regulator [Solirubrobacteraceae bacterium]|jgi:AcrR family transcriptional regulator|nr:QsdR family transcriptional regulator [Solirubrobacteraceae bacterium]